MSFASVAAPLLTGFSLTSIVELIGRSNRGTRGDTAIAAFALAAVLLIYAIQAGLAASQLAVPPDQRAAQVPEARAQREWMQRLREDQWRDAALAQELFARTRLAYNLGLLAFLAGLIAVLFPDPGGWNPIRMAALAAATMAGVMEIILTSGHPRILRRWLLPTLDLEREGQTELSDDDPPKMDLKTVQYLVYGQSNSQTEQQLAQADGRDITTALTTVTSHLASLTEHLTRLEEAATKLVAQRPQDRDDDDDDD